MLVNESRNLVAVHRLIPIGPTWKTAPLQEYTGERLGEWAR